MDTSKIIRGVVSNGRYTVTAPIVKEDYGLYLQIEGVDLPSSYQVDFSNSENSGTSVTMIGNADGVLIPHQFISTGKDVFAFLYWVGEDFGKTVYKFRIPNKLRPDRTDEQPTPEGQSVIDQTIAALNEAVESTQENADKAETAVEHYPQIVDGTWRVWDVENGQWLDTGIDAEAVDGVSPTVSISNNNGVHTVTITDADGRKTATIYDGLSIIMLTSSFVIPTDENGVLTQDVKLVAKFRVMRGNTIIDGRVMPNSSITLTNPNAPQLRVVYWREGVSVTDPQTEVTLPSGYKLVGGDSGMFSIKLRVGNTDYVVNPTWALAKRGEQGEQGEPGESGYSPTANVNKSGKTTTITITDKTGTTTEQIEDGTDGVSPTVTITPITGGHRITITDADGEHSADVMDGDDYTLTAQDKQDIAELVDVPVDDVQINGTSIVSDGVANVPLASESVHGATKYATASEIKSGGGTARSINPYRQHESTFYGLAKSAGDTTQSASSNAVGNYTEDAKIAIQKMLGIYEPPYELLNDFTLDEEGSFDITADANGTPYDLRNVLIWVAYPANLTSIATGYGRYRCFDNNGKSTNSETGRYSANTATMFKYITVERKANLAFSYFTDRTTVSGAGTWKTKGMNDTGIQAGISIGLGNIVRIACIDPEPAGTQIKIYGQRAY